MSDIETLKAWTAWKRKEIAKYPPGHPAVQEDLDLVKAVEDVISQVGTWKGRYERLHRETLAATQGRYRRVIFP